MAKARGAGCLWPKVAVGTAIDIVIDKSPVLSSPEHVFSYSGFSISLFLHTVLALIRLNDH
jgi:hypothetical protein